MNPPNNVLLPIDIEDVCHDAVDAAFEQARRQNVKVDVLYARLNKVAAWTTSSEVDNIMRGYESELARLVDAHVREGMVGVIRARLGDPERVILQTAKELGSSMIVVGTHGRQGLYGMLLGSVAAGVIKGASCPVLVMRQGASAPHNQTAQAT